VSLVFLITLIGSLERDNINLHVLCFIKQHMAFQDLLNLTLPGYTMGSSFCCVCFFCKDIHFSKINISNNCKEKDLEILVIELETKSSELAFKERL